MLTETINGIEITVNEAVVLQAVEEFLKKHIFKETLRVVRLGQKENVFDPNTNYTAVYKITCESTLARLAGGEIVH